MANIFLLRHGESSANLTGTISCVMPGPELSERGRVQITEILKDLPKKDISKIYSSPFRRTVETSLIIKNFLPSKEIIIDERIQEIDYGQYEGLTKVLKGAYVEKTLKRVISGDNNIKFGVTGENEAQIMRRLITFLKELVNNNDDVLVISHQGIISIILQIHDLVYGQDISKSIENASFCKVSFDRSDIINLNKLLKKYREVRFSPYTLVKDNNISRARFFPSVDLESDLPVTTPFTFPFIRNKVVLAYDKMGWWNPLGGHIEKGETWQEAILRESKEEGGVVIKDLEIIGYILIERLVEYGKQKYPTKSIIPVTKSVVAEYLSNWTPQETKERGLFSINKARDVLKRRTDNNQMLEIYNYIIKYCC